MAQFRKKPIVVEAEQWSTGDPLPEGCWYGAGEYFDLARCYIETPEGTMRVSSGDWIITGIRGEHYPCNSEIFALTYEAVDE